MPSSPLPHRGAPARLGGDSLGSPSMPQSSVRRTPAPNVGATGAAGVRREGGASLRPYEVMMILDPSLEDEQVKTIVDRVTELITAGGNAPRIERWGKRRLAFEINKKPDGLYFLFEATSAPAAMIELDRNLRITDGVLRYKVIRIPDHIAGRERRPLTPDPVDEKVDAEAGAAS